MGRKLLLLLTVITASFLLSGCSLKKAPAALRVNTNPSANVFIDGKAVGKTPFMVSDLKAGEVTVKLIPESASSSLLTWEGKVKLASGVLTVIDREFSTEEGNSTGYILSLETIKDTKSASVSIVSDPDGALIKINGEAKGFAPLNLDKFSEGEYDIEISKDGYLGRNFRAKVTLGYKLVVNVKLSQTGTAPRLIPTSSAAPLSGKLTPTPAKVSPTATITPSQGGQVIIKDTPTGWLRVRATPSTGAEVAKVNPGEKYPLKAEQSGWYKIEYASGKEGWVSSQYAQKTN